MAYPPPDHYLSDLGLRASLETEESRVSLDVTPALCGPGGGVLLGVLATAIDMAGGGLARRRVEPDWVATSDIAIDLAASIPPGTCRVDCRLGRRGRSLVTLDLELLADPDRRATPAVTAQRHGLATAAFAVLPDPGREQGAGPRGDGRESAPPPRRERRAVEPEVPSARARLPLYERLGLRVLDALAGAVELDLDDYVRNTFGALQGGVVAVVAEAAMLAANARPLAALAVRYRTLGRTGPFRTDVERTSGGIGDLVRATVRDAGAGHAVVAVATGRLADS